jgi:hypothetical protein
MKRWLPRFLWLFAWSCWAWLGFGLHRELPRDLGAVVATVGQARYESFVGFIDGSQVLVGQTSTRQRFSGATRLLDAPSGVTIRELPWPIGSIFPLVDMHHGVTFGSFPRSPENSASGTVKGYLYLITGTVVELVGCGDSEPAFHPRKPWAKFQSDTKTCSNVTVFDVQSGRLLFQRDLKSEQPKSICYASFFVGDDRVALACRRTQDTSQSTQATFFVELWTINSGGCSRTLIDGLAVGIDRSASRTGRVGWLSGEFVVYDFDDRRVLFSIPLDKPKPQRGFRPRDSISPVLSLDGRSILDVNAGKLWDVDDARVRWACEANSEIIWTKTIQERHRFQVRELWEFGAWPWSVAYYLYAVRDLGTGSLIYRSREPIHEQFVSSDGRLYFTGGHIREFPLRVNYPLLALCQTILALPLVLLWAMLRWRRMRMASAMP